MMKRLLQSVLALLLFGAAFTGCVKTEVVDEGPREAMVRFDVELPDVSVPATRAIQTENEAKVNSFYVLVFDKNDEFAYKKIVPSSAFTSETSGVGSTAKEIKTFNVSLLKSSSATDLYNIVLLANVDASTTLKAAVDAIIVGNDRETVLATLTQTYTGNPAMPVPMASVPKAAVQVTETTNFSGANAFNMIRMVARIDVTLASSVATNYSVKRVLYYNYNTVGRVWTKNYSGTVTTGTTLPSNPGTATAHTYYAVANTRTGGLADTHFEALLYAQEAAVNSAMNRPCIVVELEDKAGASVGHYRADFLTSSGSPKYLDILRNHRYKVEITNVYSNGFTDPDDAYNTTPVGMTATVVDWDEADMKNTIVNGNYWVSISSRELEVNYTAHTDNSISITTNVSSGWNVTGIYNDANCTIAHGGAWLTGATKSGNNLAVIVTENTSKTATRTAYVKLKAGTVEFTIKVIQNVAPTVTVSPSILTLPYTAVAAGSNNLTVTCTTAGVPDPTVTWSLTSNDPSWFLLSLDPGGLGASQTVTATGDQTVYTVATTNPSTTANRTTTVTLNGTIDVVVDVTQLFYIYGGGTPLSATTYVGAFWRADQIGERLITIPVTNTSGAAKAWSVSVYEYGDDFNVGDIVFSPDPSSDTGITWVLSTESPADMIANDAIYTVSGNATSAGGFIPNGGGNIFFRIGLKTKWSDQAGYATKPVRYAVIVVSYDGNYQKIFLRQGHEADYLTHPNDVAVSNSPYVVKFSPYNLTAPGITASYVDVPVKGGTFTDYPSQAGAFFQYAGASGWERRAWHPARINVTWNAGSTTSSSWSAISAVHETCPTIGTTNYRRPTTDELPTSTTISEYKHSLLGINLNATTGVVGYYADGFFDRRRISAQPYGSSGTSYYNDSAVAVSTTSVAYMGRLFYNDNTSSERNNASIFFPLGGYRQATANTLAEAGWFGSYWTSGLTTGKSNWGELSKCI